MAYQKRFRKPYPDGYKDRPDKSTPATAEILNMQDNTFSQLEEYMTGTVDVFMTQQSVKNTGFENDIAEISAEVSTKASESYVDERATTYDYDEDTETVKVSNGIGGGGSEMHNYSTTEQVVGLWLDDTTRYERTIVYESSSPIPNDTDILQVPDNINIVNMFVHHSVMEDGIKSKPYYVNVNWYWDLLLVGTGGKQVIRHNAGSSQKNMKVVYTIQYTKNDVSTASLLSEESEEVADE